MTETYYCNYDSRYFSSTRIRNKEAVTHRIGTKVSIFSLSINLSYRCNLDCSICLVKDRSPVKKGPELNFPIIKQILDEAASLGVLNVSFSGGEPLLHEDFENIYVYAIKKGFLVSLYSNITLLTNSTLDLFQRYPPDRIHVSVYGLSKETYEKVTRVTGSFSIFMKNLAWLREKRIRLDLQFTVCRSNEKDIENFIHHFSKKNYEHKNTSFYLYKHTRFDATRNALIEQELLPPAKAAYYDFKYRFSKEMDSLPSSSDRKKRAQNKLFWKCSRDMETLSIGPSGECCLCYEMPISKYKRQYEPDKLKEIARLLVKEKENASMPDIKCRDCPELLYCQWCPLYAYLYTGKLAPIPYFCEVMKELNLLGLTLLTGGDLCRKKRETKRKSISHLF